MPPWLDLPYIVCQVWGVAAGSGARMRQAPATWWRWAEGALLPPALATI